MNDRPEDHNPLATYGRTMNSLRQGFKTCRSELDQDAAAELVKDAVRGVVSLVRSASPSAVSARLR